MTTADKASGTERTRFGFGENWTRYATLIDDERITAAEQSLKDMLEVETLAGQRFLDVGSGSGLFSLAARNLGASVHSFDYDSVSVSCTQALQRRYRPDDQDWCVEQGDVLDEGYLAQIGQFDVVYSWGVLHHTGNMWQAINNIGPLVAKEGQLFLALYNDQRWLSRYWKKVKQLYNVSALGRVTVVMVHAPYFLARYTARFILSHSWQYRRGMDPWRDILDWLGGYPFEVARPEAVLEVFRRRAFVLDKMTTVDGRHGCNEFVFRRIREAD